MANLSSVAEAEWSVRLAVTGGGPTGQPCFPYYIAPDPALASRRKRAGSFPESADKAFSRPCETASLGCHSCRRPAQGFEPCVKEVERLDERAKRTDSWLRTVSSGDALVNVEPMEHDFNELLAGEIHRRKRVSFRTSRGGSKPSSS